METTSRTIALLAQTFFGFTGLGRIYLSSYFVGFVQFALFLTALVIFSQTTTTPETFVAATILLLLITLIWAIDSMALGYNCLRADPAPIWCWKYMWSSSSIDVFAGRVLGGALLVAVPLFLVIWLFMPDYF